MPSDSRRDFLKLSAASLAAAATGSLLPAAEPLSAARPAPAPATPSTPRGDIARAEIRTVDGEPELFINGERQSRMLGRLSCPGGYAQEKLEQYLGSGIRVFLTDIDIECSLCWDGENGYDYTPYEWHLDRILALMPDAYLWIYVGCAGAAPYKWLRAHQDELPLLSNGDRLRIPSVASELWLRDSSEALRRFVRHFESSRFAPHIVGYNLIQWSNEWHTPTSRNHSPLDDYSAPMLRAFRAWLRAHYREDVSALRAAWRDPAVTFDTAQIPSEEQRLATGALLLATPVADYRQAFDDIKTRFILGQARAVKEASVVPTLVSLSRYGGREMLESPLIDCHHGPYHYHDRKIVHLSGYAKATYRARGKLHIDQIDTGTHVMPKTGGDPLGVLGLWPGPFRLAHDEWTSLEILKRDVAFSVGLNGTLYWNEGGPGWMFPILSHGTTTWGRFWYDTPAIKALIPRLKRVVEDNIARGARPAARVAVVHSEEVGRYLAPGSRIGGLLNRMSSTMTQIGLSGVPFDSYSLEDFDRIDRSYDVYLFPNAVFVPAALRDTIRRKLAADRATAVWYFGPGYADERRADLAMIRELTGLNLRLDETAGPAHVRLAPGSAHPLLRDLGGVASFGTRAIDKPNNSDQPLPDSGWRAETESVDLPAAFWCDDPAAAVLGVLDGRGDRPGLVAEENADGTRTVWIGAPQAPWQLLRNIYRWAGVHVYSETGEQVFINSRFASLYALSTGDKLLRLPTPSRVEDALTGEVVADRATEIRFRARAGETRLFALAPLPDR